MKVYDCLTVGNPQKQRKFHDKALKKAQGARCKFHKDKHNSQTEGLYTLFVGNLCKETSEIDLIEHFSKYGRVMQAIVVKDLFGNISMGYGFVEFVHRNDAAEALKRSQRYTIKGSKIILDWQRSGVQEGWKPRRLGGGLGGRRSSGQMRFDT